MSGAVKPGRPEGLGRAVKPWHVARRAGGALQTTSFFLKVKETFDAAIFS